jgi:hypothetical protein
MLSVAMTRAQRKAQTDSVTVAIKAQKKLLHIVLMLNV